MQARASNPEREAYIYLHRKAGPDGQVADVQARTSNPQRQAYTWEIRKGYQSARALRANTFGKRPALTESPSKRRIYFRARSPTGMRRRFAERSRGRKVGLGLGGEGIAWYPHVAFPPPKDLPTERKPRAHQSSRARIHERRAQRVQANVTPVRGLESIN